MTTLSIATPAWNEARNLPVLYERIRAVADGLGVDWNWTVVDDHSGDGTFDIVRGLAARDPRVRGVRLSRNSGSHVAIGCAIDEAGGDAIAILAADLQDPPEILRDLLERWRGGAQVVWAARRTTEGGSASNGLFATVYYGVMRRAIGLTDMPATGADCFLLDRAVADALRRCDERNSSILALITWLGFRQERIEYEKQERLHGASGWSLRRKLRLVADSVTAFSGAPLAMSWMLGGALSAAGVALGAAGLSGARTGVLASRDFVLLGAVTGVGGLVLVMLGVAGEYVWRVLEESRGRPRYFVESRTSL